MLLSTLFDGKYNDLYKKYTFNNYCKFRYGDLLVSNPSSHFIMPNT